MNSKINYGDDFYTYVNYEWLSKTDIPNDHQRWSVFQMVQQETSQRIKNIIELNQDSDYIKINILYNQFNDTSTRSHIDNYNVIQKFISKIDNALNHTTLFNTVTDFVLQFNLSIPISVGIQADFNNADQTIIHLSSGGLGLPDKDYYLSDSKEDIREEYKKFIKQYSGQFNLSLDPNVIFNIEKILALRTYSRVDKRNLTLLNNVTTFDNFVDKYPNLSFIERIFIEANKKPDKINITNPNYINYLNFLISRVPLSDWKQYFIFRIITEFNDCLNYNIEKCYFDFYSGVLLGTKTMKDRWEITLDKLNELLGELLGKFYVKHYFNRESKDQVLNMVNLIKEQLIEYLINNNWMSETTKTHAITKLNKMGTKIGFPDVYEKNYSSLDIDSSNPIIINVIKCRRFNLQYRLKTIYEKPDKNKWFIPAHTVNAYYSPSYNEIVFPAGILQKPFFSSDQLVSQNFGGIGMIIGHEITHGFDDQGSKFDANGNLVNWWTPNDLVEYKKITDKVKKQYSEFTIEGEKINGELTLGENIADIGGVNLSLRALKQFFLNKHNDYDIQTFFINYANIWKSKARKEDTLYRILTDPHSPPVYRVNGVVRNMDDFYRVFNVDSNSKLYLDHSDRVIIWS